MKPRPGRAVLALAAVTLLASCGGPGEGPVVVPSEIQGIWTTPTDPYADRAFEIDEEYIYFETGEGNFDVHRIQALEVQETEDGRLYGLEYRGLSGDRHSFDFVYSDEAAGATVRIVNRELVVWRRNGAREVPWSLPQG